MSTQKIEFSSRAGAPASGEIALPSTGASGERAPGVVLIQEWWGLNDHIRSIMTRLSDEGFVVVAPDLYHGKVTKNADEAGQLMKSLDWPRAIAEIGGAVDELRKHPRCNGKVAVMGFCMGGALTLATACQIPDIAAAVPFYGIPQAADWAKAKAPIITHVAKKDEWVKPPLAEAIAKTINEHGGSMKVYVYDADHAFFNDTRPEVYSPDNAKLAWQRSIDFLKAHTS